MSNQWLLLLLQREREREREKHGILKRNLHWFLHGKDFDRREGSFSLLNFKGIT